MKTLLVTMDFPPLIGGIAEYYHNRVQEMAKTEKDIVVLADSSFFCHPELSEGSRQLKRDSSVASLPQNDNVCYKNFFTRFFWPHWLPLIWHIWRVVKKEKITRLWAGQVLPVGTAVWIVSKIFSCCYRIFYCHSRSVSLYGVNSSGDLIVSRDPHFREEDKKERNDKKLSFFVTCHGNDLLRAKQHSRKYKLAKKILRDTEFVEANTEFTKNILIKDFAVPEEKIKVVYPENTLKKEMIDEKKVRELREKYNLAGKKVLLTVARLVESKGIDLVIKTLPKVWEQVPDLVYLVIGGGDFSNQLLVISEQVNPEKDKIIFTGAVLHNNLPNYYALADAFILTPYAGSGVGAGFKPAQDIESFGIVYLEAMEFGLPIIAGDVGGAREIFISPPFQGGVSNLPAGGLDRVVNNFILVNSENIDEIAEKIIMVMK